MIATNHRNFAASALLLTFLAGAGGCKAEPSEAAPPERTSRASQAVVSGSLPVREFVQLPDLCPGSSHDIDTFSAGAALVVVEAGGGKVALQVREPGGATTAVAPASWYVTTPTALDVPGYRVACTTRATLIDRGAGPVGRVFSFDKTQGTEIVCWHSANGTSTWTEKVVATTPAGEPTDAYWPVVFASAKVGGAVVPGAFEVVYTRDADYAPWVKIAVGRASREGAFFARVTIATGQVQIFDQDTYPDWRTEANGFLGPVECGGYCGWKSNGVVWANCGGCGVGEHCSDGMCGSAACVPLTAAQACQNKPGAQACGIRSDGCGGQIVCNACPPGKLCGASGDPEYCGARPFPLTKAKLVELYEDKHQRLCGTLLDPATGVDVSMGGTCAQCVDNLCRDTPLPACIPSGGLASYTP